MNLSPKTKTLNALRGIFKNILLEKLLCFFSRGKETSNFIVKIIPNNYQYPENSIRKVERNKINYSLDISDLVDWYIYFGIKDIAHENLYSMCNPDDVALDIGTNIGSVLMNLAKITGENGRVYGFEPDEVNYSRCLNNLKLNRFTNISVEPYGLGDKKDHVFLEVQNEKNRGMNRISQKETLKGSKIFITTIDDFMEEKKIRKLNLIKIDVEGFEFNVLKGAHNTLHTYHPALFVEINDEFLKEQGASAKSLVLYLKGLGYKITHADNGAEVMENKNFDKCHFDIIGKFEDKKI